MYNSKRPAPSRRIRPIAQATPTLPRDKRLPEIAQTVSELGAKVALARAERGWSLARLAERADLSPAAVHKIEKSGMTPTVTSLMKIASALGKSVGFFVGEYDPARPVSVTRRGDRARLYTSKQGITLENVSGRYGPFWVAGAEALVEPGADSGSDPMTHPGEELVLVHEGSLRFVVDGEPYAIEAGDSIHFRTVRPHSWSNPGEIAARAMWLAIRGS